ncbi:MAG: hypothetical protein IKH64_06520 [Prevotella sp.]|nr:hypothetical protein [Prevotella sp.]
MKNLFKYTFVALAGLMGMVFSACTNDYTYDPATVSGSQVYFSDQLPAIHEISTKASSFEVEVLRVDTKDAISVPLTVTKPDNSIFTIPSSVSFAAGQASAKISIGYDPANVEYGNYEDITLSIADANLATIYGLSSYSFKAGATAWVDYGTALYREDLITTFFGVDNIVYEVPIQKNVVEEGYYRLVNPYGKYYKYNDPGDFDETTDSYLTINATDPDWVYVEESPTTTNWSYGVFSMTSYVQYYLNNGYTLDFIKSNAPQLFGKLKDGVITMPATSMLLSMAAYNNGTWYDANGSGLFAVALPGHVIADYSLECEYAGRFTDIADNDYVRNTFTFGEDVESVKYVIVPAGTDVDEIIAGIKDGSIEATEVTASGDSEIPFNEETGNYMVVAVIYAGGEPVGEEVFEFKFKSSKDNTEVFEDVAAGILSLGVADVSAMFDRDGNAWGLLPEKVGATSPIVGEAILSQSTSDPTHFKLTPFWKESNPLEFHYYADENWLSVEGVETGISSDDGGIMVTDIETFFNADLTRYGVHSGYDAENSTYNFYLFYHVGDAMYAGELETFEVTATGAKSVKKAMKKARESSQWGVKKDATHKPYKGKIAKCLKRVISAPAKLTF